VHVTKPASRAGSVLFVVEDESIALDNTSARLLYISTGIYVMVQIQILSRFSF
jgi:hypothetical protein